MEKLEEKEIKKKKKDKKKEEIEKLTEINLELEQKLLRIQAEFQNYMRRTNEEATKMMKYANEELVVDMLPIIDNFERAINMDDDNKSDEVTKFLEGFMLIYQNLVEILKKIEVEEMDCLDKPFDPSYHNAVMTDTDESKEKDLILDVLQKGYMYKDRVIRPAMVKVNK